MRPRSQGWEVNPKALEVSADTRDVLARFADLVRQWNRAFNLVSRADIGQIWHRHIDDSLRLLPIILDRRAGTVLDVGTGGGFPGMVIAIAAPGVGVTLTDRSERKCRFLTQAATELHLANVTVACQDVTKSDDLGRCDVVTSRAVADVNAVWTMSQRLLNPGGALVHMTGGGVITVREQQGQYTVGPTDEC